MGERIVEAAAELLYGQGLGAVSAEKIIAQAIGAEACSPGFRGCPFINAAAEYADPGHPVRRAVDAHRRWFRQAIQDLLAEIDVSNPAQAADQLVMLRDGAMVGGYLSDPGTVAVALRSAATAVIAFGNRPAS